MNDIYGDYYSPIKLMSYGRPYNFSVGSRSIGKTTGYGIFLITEAIRKGKKFVYVRRDEDELALTAQHYFDDASDLYNNWYDKSISIEYRGKQGYFLDGENIGYAVPLSKEGKYKSAAELHKVWYILYDEFMCKPGGHYLGGVKNRMSEVQAMHSLFTSIDREKNNPARNETRVIFIGNAGTLYNPFFVRFGIDRMLRHDTKYLAPKNELWVLENTDQVEATKNIQTSWAYRLGTDSQSGYAFHNEFADIDNSRFICKKPGKSRRPVCNLVLDGEYYGVYVYENEGLFYVCHDKITGGFMNFALTTPDHAPNYYLLRRYSDHIITHEIKRMYDLSCIRFYDHKCKFALDFFLGYMV